MLEDDIDYEFLILGSFWSYSPTWYRKSFPNKPDPEPSIQFSFDGEIVSNAPGVRTCTGVISGCTFDDTIAKDCVSTCVDNDNFMD